MVLRDLLAHVRQGGMRSRPYEIKADAGSGYSVSVVVIGVPRRSINESLVGNYRHQLYALVL